jgi:porin
LAFQVRRTGHRHNAADGDLHAGACPRPTDASIEHAASIMSGKSPALASLAGTGLLAASLSCSGAEWGDTLTGDWNGARSQLSEDGVDIHLGLKADVLSVVRGGQERGVTYLDLWEAKIALDGKRLLGWNGGQAFLHVISNHGGKFNTQSVGSAQGVDNIEVATNTSKIFQAWVEQAFLDGRASLRAGLMDLNAEFYVTDSSSVFLHPTFGMGSDLAQTGKAGPSIYPTSSFGVRFKYEPSSEWYAQAIVLDGVPGSPANPYGTHIEFNKGDGALTVAEAGWQPFARAETTISAKYALGAWHYTPRFDDLVGTDAAGNPLRRVNQGAYVFAERTLTQEADDPAQGLTAFVRYGVANADVNRFDQAIGIGFIYRGLLPGRDRDVFGFAIAAEHNSPKHREQTRLAGGLEPAAESAYELTYRAQLTPWLALQPECQFVKNHAEPAISDTWLAGARVEITF